MALVWIKRVDNHLKAPITLRQDDPTYHPVIHRGTGLHFPDTPGAPQGTVSGDFQVPRNHRIVIAPGGSLTCDWFVIPWESHGRLEIAVEGGDELVARVGPQDGGADHIKFEGGGKSVKPVEVGPRGPGYLVDVKLVLSDDKGVLFTPTGSTDLIELGRHLLQIAMDLYRLISGSGSKAPAR